MNEFSLPLEEIKEIKNSIRSLIEKYESIINELKRKLLSMVDARYPRVTIKTSLTEAFPMRIIIGSCHDPVTLDNIKIISDFLLVHGIKVDWFEGDHHEGENVTDYKLVMNCIERK